MNIQSTDNTAPILDTTVLDELHSIVEDEFTDVLKLYLDESARLMSIVHDGFEIGGDMEELTCAVHSFKSSSNSVGAKKLGYLTAKMEYLLRSEKCDSAKFHLNELQDVYTRTQSEMNDYIVVRKM